MSESVVAGSAENRAAFAVVVLVTQEPVGVAQLGSAGRLHVFGPLLPHGKMALSGDPADQTIWDVCRDKGAVCQVGQGSIGHTLQIVVTLCLPDIPWKVRVRVTVWILLPL